MGTNFGLKQKVCKLELESSYYERCTRSSKSRVWSLSSRTIGRMFESCSLQTTMTDTQLFQTIHAILPRKASQSEVPVGAGPVKKMTSQPKLKLPPRIRGNKRKFAGSEMKRGPAEKLLTGTFYF